MAKNDNMPVKTDTEQIISEIYWQAVGIDLVLNESTEVINAAKVALTRLESRLRKSKPKFGYPDYRTQEEKRRYQLTEAKIEELKEQIRRQPKYAGLGAILQEGGLKVFDSDIDTLVNNRVISPQRESHMEPNVAIIICRMLGIQLKIFNRSFKSETKNGQVNLYNACTHKAKNIPPILVRVDEYLQEIGKASAHNAAYYWENGCGKTN